MSEGDNAHDTNRSLAAVAEAVCVATGAPTSDVRSPLGNFALLSDLKSPNPSELQVPSGGAFGTVGSTSFGNNPFLRTSFSSDPIKGVSEQHENHHAGRRRSSVTFSAPQSPNRSFSPRRGPAREVANAIRSERVLFFSGAKRTADTSALRCPQLAAAALALSFLLHSESDTRPTVSVEDLFTVCRLPLHYATSSNIRLTELADIIRRFMTDDPRFALYTVEAVTLDQVRRDDADEVSGGCDGVVDTTVRTRVSASDFRAEVHNDSITRDRVKILCFDPEVLEQGLAIVSNGDGEDEDEDEEDANHTTNLKLFASFVSPSVRILKRHTQRSQAGWQRSSCGIAVDMDPSQTLVGIAAVTVDASMAPCASMSEAPVSAVHLAMLKKTRNGRAQGYISIKKRALTRLTSALTSGGGSGVFMPQSSPLAPQQPPAAPFEQGPGNSGGHHQSPPELTPRSRVNTATDNATALLSTPPAVGPLTESPLSLHEHGVQTPNFTESQATQAPVVAADIMPMFDASFVSGSGSAKHALRLLDIGDAAFSSHVVALAVATSVLRGIDRRTNTPFGADVNHVVSTLRLPVETLCNAPLRLDQVFSYFTDYIVAANHGWRAEMIPVLQSAKRRGASTNVSVAALTKVLAEVAAMNDKGRPTNERDADGEVRVRLDPFERANTQGSSESKNGTPETSSVPAAGGHANVADDNRASTGNAGTPLSPKAVLVCCFDPNTAHSTINISASGPHWAVVFGYRESDETVLLCDTAPNRFGATWITTATNLHRAMTGHGFFALCHESVDILRLVPPTSDGGNGLRGRQTVDNWSRSEAPLKFSLIADAVALGGVPPVLFPTMPTPLALAAVALRRLGLPTTIGDFLLAAPCPVPFLFDTEMTMQDLCRCINFHVRGREGLVAVGEHFRSNEKRDAVAGLEFLSRARAALQEPQQQQLIVHFSRHMLPRAPPTSCSVVGDFALVVGLQDSVFVLLDCNPEACHRCWTVGANDLFKAAQDVCLRSRRNRGLITIARSTVSTLGGGGTAGSASFTSAAMFEKIPTNVFDAPSHPFRLGPIPHPMGVAIALCSLGFRVGAECVFFGAHRVAHARTTGQREVSATPRDVRGLGAGAGEKPAPPPPAPAALTPTPAAALTSAHDVAEGALRAAGADAFGPGALAALEMPLSFASASGATTPSSVPLLSLSTPRSAVLVESVAQMARDFMLCTEFVQGVSHDEGSRVCNDGGLNGRRVSVRRVPVDELDELCAALKLATAPFPDGERDANAATSTSGAQPPSVCKRALLLVYNVRAIHAASHEYSACGVVSNFDTTTQIVTVVDAEPGSWCPIWAASAVDVLRALFNNEQGNPDGVVGARFGLIEFSVTNSP